MNSGRKALLWTLAPVVLLLPLLLWQGKRLENQLEDEQRIRVQQGLALRATALQKSFDRIDAKLASLAEFVAAQDRDGRPADHAAFATFAAGLHSSTKWIRSFQIVSSGIITQSYPVQGNEFANGYNLLTDPRPMIGRDVLRALADRQVTITGPLNLIQGGVGIILRKPLPPTADEPARLVTIVLNIAPLLADAGIAGQATSEVQIAIRRDTGEVFFGPPAVFEHQPVTQQVTLPDGAWEMGAWPVEGWRVAGRDSVRLLYLMGGVIIGLIGLLVFAIARHQANLTATVAERTLELRDELAARRRERDFSEAVLNSLPGVVYCFDRDFRFVRWNKNLERVLGYTGEEIARISPLDLFAEADKPLLAARFQEVFDRGTSDVEADFLTKDGRSLPYFFTGVTAPIDGQPHLVGVGIDISKRRLAEEAVRESENRFRTMANSMSQLAWTARADGYIYWYNERWYEYTGTTPEQMEGWGWQSVHDPKVLPKVMENWKGAIAAGQPFEMEFPLRRADGQFRAFLTRGQPLKDAAGQVVQWFGTNTDVDELKQAEEKVRQLNTALEERVAGRTADLAARNKELERLNRLFVDRELRMKELKLQIKDLEEKSRAPGGEP